MSHIASISTRPTRTLSPSLQPPSPQAAASAVASPTSSAGTTYEMCLALEHDEPQLARQFRRLLDAIIGQLPTEQGGTILFTGSGSSSHVADVAGQLAKQMTTECRSDVMLVDADAGQKVLSQRFAAASEKGLVDALQADTSAGRFAVSTAVPRMSFLAFGESLAWRRGVAHDAVRDVVAQWKRQYRYTVIAAGNELNRLTGLLARHCDATYLVVQLGQAEKHQTSQLARELIAAGARLLGSVATGVRN
ncbi:MAG: P-loop NTPase family protein [Pirellulaceae bacterium]